MVYMVYYIFFMITCLEDLAMSVILAFFLPFSIDMLKIVMISCSHSR